MTAKLRVLDAEPLGDGIIKCLEEALDLARAGELSSVGVAVVYRDGSTSYGKSQAPSRGLLHFAASSLAFNIMQEVEGEQ